MTSIIKTGNLSKVSLPVLFFSLSLVVNLINNQKFGAALPIQLIFISLFFLSFFLSKKKIILKSAHILSIILWLVISFSSLTSSTLIEQRGTIYFLIFTMYYVLGTGMVLKQIEFDFIIKTYIYTASVGSLNIIFNYLTENYYQVGRYSTSFFGVIKDPNYSSAIIVPAILLLLYLLEKEKKAGNLILLVILTIGVLLSGSRASFAILIFSYVYFFLLFIFKFKMILIKKITLIIILTFLMFCFWPIINSFLPEGIIERVTDFESYTDNIRLNIWLITLNVFENASFKELLFGLGLETSNIYSVRFTNHYTHNIYIDLLFSSGLIGMITFILMLLVKLKIGKSNIYFLIGLIVVFLGPLFFINGLNTSSFWIPMIIIGMTANNQKLIEDEFQN